MLSFRPLEEVVVGVHSSDKVCLNNKVNKYHYLRNLIHFTCSAKDNLFLSLGQPSFTIPCHAWLIISSQHLKQMVCRERSVTVPPGKTSWSNAL